MICDKCKTKMEWDTITFCPKCENLTGITSSDTNARIINDSVTVKTARIDEIILFILEEDQSFSDDDTYSSDNFSSQIVQKLENLKKAGG